MAPANIAPAVAPRSWAQIVNKKAGVEDANAALKPGARGSLLRLVRGKVLTMFAHYGWLMLFGNTNHPAADKHDGDVYVSKTDIVEGENLRAGDVVEFYLYSDDQGLGAEECRLIERAPESSFNADAAEFVPGGFVMRADACAFVPNWSFKEDSEDESDEEVIQEDTPLCIENVQNVAVRLATLFADDSDSDSEGEWESPALDTTVKDIKSHLAPSSDGSTAALSSDSEEDLSSGFGSDSEEDDIPAGWKVAPGFRPPPGLSLKGFRPPPGLVHPNCEEEL
jgi:cold shock CspA family protein